MRGAVLTVRAPQIKFYVKKLLAVYESHSFLGSLFDVCRGALHHPAAAAGDDLVVCKILKNVIRGNAARRHDMEIGEGRRYGLDGL